MRYFSGCCLNNREEHRVAVCPCCLVNLLGEKPIFLGSEGHHEARRRDPPANVDAIGSSLVSHLRTSSSNVYLLRTQKKRGG
jgi:hypothetical protein